jgi:hypothetical protein
MIAKANILEPLRQVFDLQYVELLMHERRRALDVPHEHKDGPNAN